MFLFGVRKTFFAMPHFLVSKNFIPEALWKQRLYISVDLSEKMFVPKT